MIFYFSGTGNSFYAAKKLAEEQGEQLISVAKELEKKDQELTYEFQENDTLGFVFPVYAWAPPKLVLDFINRFHWKGVRPYVFSFCTCGDEEGRTTDKMREALKKKGLVLDSAFSLLMPNNYIIGFDVDPKEIEQAKLEHAEPKLREINKIISMRQKNVFQIIPGKHPSFKTAVINPMFNRFALSTKKFYAEDICTGCKLCERICPVHTITVEGKPVWGKACTQCLGCIHRCPVQAIQYGDGTKKKGRYHHPVLTEEKESK